MKKQTDKPTSILQLVIQSTSLLSFTFLLSPTVQCVDEKSISYTRCFSPLNRIPFTPSFRYSIYLTGPFDSLHNKVLMMNESILRIFPFPSCPSSPPSHKFPSWRLRVVLA